jgi:ferredoxin
MPDIHSQRPPPEPLQAGEDPTLSARLEPDGIVFDLSAAVPVLLAAELAGIALPSSCRNGTCRTCLCRMVEGRVAYRIEWPGLSAEEKREGYFLPCVAYAQTDLVMMRSG